MANSSTGVAKGEGICVVLVAGIKDSWHANLQGAAVAGVHAGPILMVVGKAWNSHQMRHEAQGA